MIQTKIIAVLFLAGQILCQNQNEKSQKSTISDFDPQLLNYQLQQLAIQQFSNQEQQSQQPQIQQYDTQSLQYPAPVQQYENQQRGLAGQNQQLTQQDYDAALLLQTRLFEPFQGHFGNIQTGQYNNQQSSHVAPQPSTQQLPKQRLLGVAYSSAADASKTSFTGYGIKYSF